MFGIVKSDNSQPGAHGEPYNFADLPEHLKVDILNKLTPYELCQFRLVANEYNSLIMQNQQLSKTIHMTDPKAAIRSMKKANDKVHALLRIAKVEASVDKEQAKATLRQARHFVDGLENITDRERSQLIYKVVKVGVQIDLEFAEEIIPSSQSYSAQMALGEVIKFEARTDLKKAKERAETLQNLCCRISTLLEIAKREAINDNKQAQCTLHEAKQLVFQVDADIQAATLLEIAKVEMEIAHTQPLETIERVKLLSRLMRSSHDRLVLFSQIVNVEAEIDIEKAKKTVLTFGEGKKERIFKDQALVKVVKKEARIDLERAHQTALSIAHDHLRQQAILETWKVNAHQDLEVTKTYAYRIINPTKCFYKEELFLEVVKAEAQMDLKLAKVTALGIRKRIFRDMALLEIVKREASINRGDAKSTASLIWNPKIRFKALLAIAKSYTIYHK